MSMWLDQKYIGILSIHLDQFKRKGGYNFNFRCPLCGDSQKNKTKTRGYIYPNKNALFYKCHNCQASCSLGNLIKDIDQTLYKEYCLERYSSGEGGRKSHKEHGFVFKPVKFDSNSPKNLMERLLKPLKDLDENHEAIKYVHSRKIPRHRYNKIYYVENVQDLKQLASGYDDKIVTNEPRLVLPYFDKENKLVGLTARGIRGEKFRYLNLKIDVDNPMIYGLETIDTSKTIYVTEGPIDSLFLPNCVAASNANLKMVSESLPKDNLVLIYDNEPRNKEIVKNMKSAIDVGFTLCIWPKSYTEKDINDMVLKSKIDPEELLNTIAARTFSGPKLSLEFNNWRI